MNKKVKIKIEVEAVSEADLKNFLKLCAMIQKLGEVGASREIRVSVDGDGSGRLSFYLNGKRVPSINFDTENIPKVYIGG